MKKEFSFAMKKNAARGDCNPRTRRWPSPHAEIKSPHAAFFIPPARVGSFHML